MHRGQIAERLVLRVKNTIWRTMPLRNNKRHEQDHNNQNCYVGSHIIRQNQVWLPGNLRYFCGHLTRSKVDLTSTARWQRQPFIVGIRGGG